MLTLSAIALVPAVVLPSGADQMTDARLLVESQVQVAAVAAAVLEEKKLSAAARAERLLPLASELARLHERRAQADAAQLEQEEARAAADAAVQQLALRLLFAIECCAASNYEDSPQLRTAVQRLALAIEGQAAQVETVQGGAPTAQSGAE